MLCRFEEGNKRYRVFALPDIRTDYKDELIQIKHERYKPNMQNKFQRVEQIRLYQP